MMINIAELTDLRKAYDYQLRLAVPCFFPTSFERWKESFENDIDGEGRPLFRQLHAKAAYDGESLIGFIQYGSTAFGFDSCGEISGDVSYPVIRTLYFDRGREDAGALLLQAALEELRTSGTVYAFFHYFGMSCFARHGKLFEPFTWIAELLHKTGFVVEHENVYYSADLQHAADSAVELVAHSLTNGGQQTLDFVLDHKQIGCCEVHYVDTGIAYLRWIYIYDDLQNQGVGSRCMSALQAWLNGKGIARLDTDTALDNQRAQHYYEKNGFTREGITRSYYLTK